LYSKSLTRRTFLQAAAAATVATQFKSAPAQASPAYPENGILIPDDGWTLWIDEHARWQDDAIFLPDDVNLTTLPVNPPTGGWSVLTPAAGKQVILPATVEQHFWGKYTHRPYTPDEYRYAATDPIPQNGAYYGVSWWHRSIDIPAAMRGKRIFLNVRGARLRAEVYLNQKLVGYSIMEELPFECDLTAAANPGGENHLAIRITNPFGRYDWVDGLNAQWGAVSLYRSHGFGGLDRGMTISSHDKVRIKDAWVLNNPDPKKIRVYVEIESPALDQPTFNFEILDPKTGNSLLSEKSAAVSADEKYNASHEAALSRKQDSSGRPSQTKVVYRDLTCKDAQIWDLDTPFLYNLIVSLTETEHYTVPVGFRWFAPAGVGRNAELGLNGRRIRLYSAISWGYWGLNGLFPTPELAEKEVTQAKKFNLNCLNFHRNVGKEEVFRAHDRLGLLRYMEPGGGKLAIGKPTLSKIPGDTLTSPTVVLSPPVTDTEKFAQRFMIAKCIAMVRAFRSHPSLIQYTLQNEISADLEDPATIAILDAMRAEDPSRIIALNDGFSPAPRLAAQAWYEPYNDKIHRSDKQDWGDWWNNHQAGGDQWYDNFYTDPRTFIYLAPYWKVLTEFGEMEGCATPDNHSLMIHQITEAYSRYGGTSYDLTDHKEILAATDRFLDKWGFREAFPSTESLWLSLGAKCYDTWQNYLENARLGQPLDVAVISGWESTAIENHSGIVDNLRNFKSDPTPISGTLLPLRPVAKQRSACTPLREAATFDLFLLNDTTTPATGNLDFYLIAPSGKRVRLELFASPEGMPETFAYLIKEAVKTQPLMEEGLYSFKFGFTHYAQYTQTKEIWVTNTRLPQKRVMKIAVSGVTSALRKQLTQLLDVTVEDFVPGHKYDVIVTSGLVGTDDEVTDIGDASGMEAQPGAKPAGSPPPPGTIIQIPPPKVVPPQHPGHVAETVLRAARTGTPLLVIPQTDALSDGVAKQLAAAGAFTYHGTVGDFRAPWMGNWYFVRKHPLYDGMPVNQVMGFHYQVKGRQSNGLLIDGPHVEIVAAYSRDHDRNIGAGTFVTRLGTTKLVYQRVPEMHPVLQQRFLSNAVAWLTDTAQDKKPS
jgi:beta-galactosidase